MKAQCKKTLVIGLGNPLSGDDGFGTRVVESLSHHQPELSPDVTLVDAHTDLLNQIENFPAYERIVLIDAILDPEAKLGQSGRIAVFDEGAFLSWPEISPSVHQFSPLLAVKLFRHLHPEALTQIILIGLSVDQIRHTPYYATDERIQEGADAVRTILR